MKVSRIERRTFLRGVRAMVPLPFLNLMEASAAKTEAPQRFVTLFKPNGIHPPSWNINGGSEHEFEMSPMMAPFAKHREDLIVLDNMGDFGFSAHKHSTRRFLSGHHGNTRTASIDQLIAEKIGGETMHRSLELTTEGLFNSQIGCSYISYDAKGDPVPRESDPQLVFDRLFRNPMTDPQRRETMKSVLDRVQDDAKSLNRRVGREDQETLDAYFTTLRETERKLESLDNVGLPEHVDSAKLIRPDMGATLDDRVETMLELMALALWTDSTRCATYMLGNSNSRLVFDFLGISEQHHYLSHFFRNFSKENVEALMKISLWHMEKFDSLLTK
ncbi:MAG: DUF1552 domain-containing protein, partial [Verrucomicrobiota bacterium]